MALVSIYLSLRIRAVSKQSDSLAEQCGLKGVQDHHLHSALFQLFVVPPAELYLHNSWAGNNFTALFSKYG